MAYRKRDVAKARAWRRWIVQQRKSGLSVRAFCIQQQISEPSFYAWRRTLAERKAGRKPARATRQRKRRPAFVSLTPSASPPLTAGLFQPAASLELVHPRGHVLRITAGCDRSTLSMVLGALSAEADREEAASC